MDAFVHNFLRFPRNRIQLLFPIKIFRNNITLNNEVICSIFIIALSKLDVEDGLDPNRVAYIRNIRVKRND